MTAAPLRSPPRGFDHVETWVFDLDNTLYPHHLNLWQQVDERIRAYVSDFLKVPADEVDLLGNRNLLSCAELE